MVMVENLAIETTETGGQEFHVCERSHDGCHFAIWYNFDQGDICS